MDLLNVDVIQ